MLSLWRPKLIYVKCYSVCQCDPNLDLPGKREKLLRHCFYQIGLWTCVCVGGYFLDSYWCSGGSPTLSGWYHPLADVPGLSTNSNWRNPGKKVSKELSSINSASVPATRFLLWVPVLTFLNEGQWCEAIRNNKPNKVFPGQRQWQLAVRNACE